MGDDDEEIIVLDDEEESATALKEFFNLLEIYKENPSLFSEEDILQRIQIMSSVTDQEIARDAWISLSVNSKKRRRKNSPSVSDDDDNLNFLEIISNSPPTQEPQVKRSKPFQEFMTQLNNFKENPSSFVEEELITLLSKIDNGREQTIAFEELEAIGKEKDEMEQKEILTNFTDEKTSNFISELTSAESHRYSGITLKKARNLTSACLTNYLYANSEDHLNCLHELRILMKDGFLKLENLKDFGGLCDAMEGSNHKFLQMATPEQFDLLTLAFQSSVGSQKGSKILHSVYEVKPNIKAKFNKSSPMAKTVLLCHCSRSPHATPLILGEGLQVKGQSGRLGAAIYLSDAIEKCLQYSSMKPVDGKHYGIVFVVEAVLGKIYETNQNMSNLREPPAGYDSVQAIGKCTGTVPKNVYLRDGSCSEIMTGPLLKREGSKTVFDHNEFAVYDATRARVRFILIFESSFSSPSFKPTMQVSHDSFSRASALNLADTPTDKLFLAYQTFHHIRKKTIENLRKLQQDQGLHSEQVLKAKEALDDLSANQEIFTRLFLAGMTF